MEEIEAACDPSEVCRMCLSYISDGPEFYLIEDDLQNMIFTATGISIDVSDRNRPLNMCSSCFYILTQFQDAKTAWIKNQQVLDSQENSVTEFRDDDEVFEEDEVASQDYQEVSVEDEYRYSVDYDDLQFVTEGESSGSLEAKEEKQENPTPAQVRPKRSRTKVPQRSNDKEKGKMIYQRLLQECSTCGKVVEKNRMEGHINKHRNVRPFICDAEDCGKTFYCKLLLRLHKTSIHTGKSFQCDICPRSFPSSRSLYSHKIRHTNKDKYNCTYCDRRFNNTNSLKRHLAIHSGIRDYSCDFCKSSFYRKFNLDTHVRTVHNKDKSEVCNFCPKKFGYARLLRHHVKITHPEEYEETAIEYNNVETLE